MADVATILARTNLDAPEEVTKRNGAVVPFDPNRIESAVTACYASLDEFPVTPVEAVVKAVVTSAAARHGAQVHVEQIQDLVEVALLSHGEVEAARHYISYRSEHASKRVVVPDDVRAAFVEDAKWFPTPGQRLNFYDKYSRYNHILGRRETWPETVRRAIDHLRWEVRVHVAVQEGYEDAATMDDVDLGMLISELPVDESWFTDLHDAILNMEVMPSMRLLAMAGPAARRNSMSLYNCSYLPLQDIDAFAEIMLISMAGGGVGFSVERQYVEQLPRVQRQTGEVSDFVIPDTTEGWGESIRFGLNEWFSGRDVRWDASNVRPAGSVLKTKGGRASGPEPLLATLKVLRDVVLSRQGSTLRTTDAGLMACAVGDAAVQGGVRRTAMICLFDRDDSDMRQVKSRRDMNPLWHNANISTVWEESPSDLDIILQMTEMIESGSGESGIFSRYNAIKNRPERRKSAMFGTNPCLLPDAWVQTTEGPRQVRDLIGRPFWALVDGKAYQSRTGMFPTREAEVYRLATEEGYALDLTDNHEIRTLDGQMVAAGDLAPGDKVMVNNHRGVAMWPGDGTFNEGLLVGAFVGDGNWAINKHTRNGVAEVKVWHRDEGYEGIREALAEATQDVHTRSNWGGWRDHSRGYQVMSLPLSFMDRFVARGSKILSPTVERSSSEFHRGFLRGLFDADGHVEDNLGKGASVRLNSSNRGHLEVVQRMLLRLGIRSKVYEGNGSKKMTVRGETFDTGPAWRLVISATDLDVYAEKVGFSHDRKRERMEKVVSGRRAYSKPWAATVQSFEYVTTEQVYDCTVDEIHLFDANGFVVSNCGEIILRPFEFCNLSQAICRPGDTEEDLARKVRLATFAGKVQSLSTRFPGLRPEWETNGHEERLMGVDLTAQHDCELTREDDAKGEMLRERLKTLVRRVDTELSSALGVVMSAASTTDKPAGNSTEMTGATCNGINAAKHPFWVRRVTLGTHSPVFKVLKAAGAPLEPKHGQEPSTATQWMVEYPKRVPEGARTAEDMSAVEQCEFWLLNKEHWTEHNPSCTINYHPNELVDLIKWVSDHRDRIGGLTFFPVFDAIYPQLPIEKITEEEYERRVAEFPDVDYSLLWAFEHEDMSEAAQELACFAGSCTI